MPVDRTTGPVARPLPQTPAAGGPDPVARPLDLTVRPETLANVRPGGPGDAFGVRTTAPMSLGGSVAVDQKVQTAVAAYQSRVEQLLHHDAVSLAHGQRPLGENDPIPAETMAGLKDAARDLLMNLPIGQLAPEAQSSLGSLLADQLPAGTDLRSLTLNDLRDAGRDAAKALLHDLKDEHPSTFYGLAAGALALVGVVGATQGSDGLRKLGIRPQVQTKLFGDAVRLKVEAQFGPGFSNPGATVGLSGKVGASGTLSADATVDGSGFVRGGVEYALRRDDLSLSANARFDASGVTSVGVNGSWQPRPDLTLSGSATHDFVADRTQVGADVSWKVRQNVDLALSASHDSRGDSRVGLGLRVTF